MSRNKTKDKIIRLNFAERGFFQRQIFGSRQRERLPLSVAITGLTNALQKHGFIISDDLALDDSIKGYLESIRYYRNQLMRSKYRKLTFNKLTPEELRIMKMAEDLMVRRSSLLRPSNASPTRRKNNEAKTFPLYRINNQITRTNVIEDEAELPLRTKIDDMIQSAEQALETSNSTIESLKSKLKA